MNSTYERKSAADMRAAQKQTLAQAEAVQKTVAVMEPNWQALIASQKQQVETLAQILERLGLLAKDEELQASLADIQKKLAVLATRGEMHHFMNRQISVLTTQQKQSVEATEIFQQMMVTATEEAEVQIKNAAASIEARCGQVSEKFSKAISEQQLQMRKWMLRCLLISLIPSVLQVILLLTQLI